MATITIDPNYGYVLLAATSTFIMNLIHGINTGKYRKAAKTPYPAAYADASRTDNEANQFNCAQRSHVTYIESQPSAVGAMLIAGLQFPLTAAALGAGWTVSRYLYMAGYSTGENGGKGRYRGISYIPCQLGLFGLCVWTGVSLVMKGM